MSKSILRRLFATVAATLASSALLASSAMAGTDSYCFGYGMSSGGTCASGIYEGSITYVKGWSNSGLSGVWVQNGSGVRVSADGYCNVAGCDALVTWWSPPRPNGYPAVHNHGGSYNTFYGEAGWV
jgi:hypothetical protein